MNKITQLIEICRDGTVIDEAMTIEDVIALEGNEKVVEVRWRNGSHSISIRDDCGLWVKIVAGGSFVAVSRYDESGKHAMFVFNANGTQRFQLPNVQIINGKSEDGEFLWIEEPYTKSANVFRAIFERVSDHSQWWLDINAESGEAVRVHEAR
ncbi:hypothetical protein [Desulfovibrio subterraneus]|uniref:Uncharacterized protein n=1 Tax=Desulfovibrio subterraneus TaxID=2718620 RepID=A0A7J0BPA6_9BACT|nr:hypothetical protein [Desulfovibrio subterraneus]GFM35111.1 hypothetical protein DSM101010T_34760 [Desulfovibrio subterraneus]